MGAVGQYVTLAAAKLRLLNPGEADSTNDTLISWLCAQVNQTIESKTSRILAPIPAFDTTFSGAAGSQTITMATATGLAAGDDLLLGPLSGTHEAQTILALDLNTTLPTAAWHATHTYALNAVAQPVVPNGHTYIAIIAGDSDTVEPVWPTDGSGIIDGTVVWLDQGAIFSGTATVASPLVNAYGSGTVCQRIYVEDGHDAIESRTLVFSRGIIALAALEVAPYSRGPFAVASQADYFLRPTRSGLTPGWPFTEITWTDVPAGTTYPVFYPGYANIRLIGPGPCVASGMASASAFGWPAVPDDIRNVAEKLFLGFFRERASSGGDSMTVNLDGSRVYERALSYEDKRTVESYRLKKLVAV